MLEGPGTSHRCDGEWSLKNLFLWGPHCQKVLRAKETDTHTQKEKVTGTIKLNVTVLHTMLLSGHVTVFIVLSH